MESQWGAEIIETPRDGACFFTAIAMAMNDALEMWCAVDQLRVPMEEYWNIYHNMTDDVLTEVTPDLIRFMCSENIDDNILVMFNEEAKLLKRKMFRTTKLLGKHMRKKSTWGDQAALFCFVKSLNFECGVIIFDSGDIIRLPEEWTKDKKAYICLKRENHHYNVIRFWKKNGSDQHVPLPLCLTKEDMISVLRTFSGVYHLEGISRIPVIY